MRLFDDLPGEPRTREDQRLRCRRCHVLTLDWVRGPGEQPYCFMCADGAEEAARRERKPAEVPS